MRAVFVPITVACIATVVLPLCLSGCRTVAVSRSGEGVASIEVVRTWRDLLDQPAIRGVGDCTARVGVEALNAPRNSGVLLYCVTEGYSLPEKWYGGYPLGPFTVRIIREGEDDRLRSLESAIKPAQDLGDSTVLFRLSIPLAGAGVYHVRLFSPEDKLLASAELTATDQKYHPWMPFDRPVLDKLEERRDEYDAVGRVTNRGDGIAIPRFHGIFPIVFRGTVGGKIIKRDKQEPLPTLFPKIAGEGLKVTVKGSGLLVEADRDIRLARPDWHFLARWWVNGVPYIPEQLGPFSDADGMMFTGKKLLLHLDFDPARIGARQGDKVELQLLYCKNGWELVLPGGKIISPSLLETSSPELLLSNRVELR